jgi:hypothetical protein
VVGGREEGGAPGALGVFERAIASRPRTRLEVPADFDAHERSVERHAEAKSMLFGEVELARRLGPKPVIHAVRGELEAELRGEAREHVEECHRVGATGNRDEHAIAALEPAFLA